MNSRFLEDLHARGLIADLTAADELDAHLASGSRTIYVGFDPTADSLHIGSLLPLLGLRRAQLHGHRPIVLVGGGTGLIGDPSGKLGERALNPVAQVAAWGERLKAQVRPFMEFDDGPSPALLVDNYDWLSRLDLISFLRDVGKHFGIGAMIARESVRARLGSGISYTEFSYQLLQAYDFVSLFDRHACTVQMGGTDQWGNITSGTELIHKMRGATAYGLTFPLVTKADGTKFGKTESGTVWLDAAKTSAYEMYQFWLNTADADVVRFLNYFTFLSPADIDVLRSATEDKPDERRAQRVLAREVTALVHGDKPARDAEQLSSALFGGDGDPFESIEGAAVPGAVLPAEGGPRPVWRVLREAGFVKSASEARRLIQQGGVEIGGRRVTDATAVLDPGVYRIKLGKRRIFRVVIEGGGGPGTTGTGG